MQEPTVIHATFTIRRQYRHSAAKVFAAFADLDKKRRWFAEGPGFVLDSYEMDFRVGGRESAAFRFVGNGPLDAGTSMRNETWYLDIVPDQRIINAYNMIIGDKCISSSLASVEILPSAHGVEVLFTEQGAYYDGADGAKMREAGWLELLDRLDKELAS